MSQALYRIQGFINKEMRLKPLPSWNSTFSGSELIINKGGRLKNIVCYLLITHFVNVCYQPGPKNKGC